MTKIDAAIAKCIDMWRNGRPLPGDELPGLWNLFEQSFGKARLKSAKAIHVEQSNPLFFLALFNQMKPDDQQIAGFFSRNRYVAEAEKDLYLASRGLGFNASFPGKWRSMTPEEKKAFISNTSRQENSLWWE